MLAAIFSLSLLGTPIALLMPLPLKVAVDGLTSQQPLPGFVTAVFPNLSVTATSVLVAVGMLLSISLIANLHAFLGWRLNTITGERLVWDLRARLLDHVQRLPMSFHDREGTRDSAYRIQHDAPAIQNVLLQGMMPLVTAIGTLFGMIYVCWRVDALIALVAVCITPVLFSISYGCSRYVRTRSTRVKELDSRAIAVIDEVLGGIRVIKAFGQEHREYDRFVRHSSKRVEGQVRLSTAQGSFNLLTGMTIALGSALVLYLGVQHVQARLLTVGELLIVMAYVSQIYDPLRILSNKVSEMQVWFASLERAFALLSERSEIEENHSAISLGHAEGEVEFRNVSFQHHPRHRGLRNISFAIPVGSRVGIVGSSGAGKTTLINLLMRFYDAQQGEVLLDGRNVREYHVPDLRRQFSVVLQEPLLFATTIAENIAYGKPDAATEEIIAAAQSAGAHEFISNLPDGYDTVLGERGGRLSGGERQRISLARAFLRNSPMLVLDEPTSALDNTTEASVAAAMDRLMQGRTTFMIAHRVHTLRSCDIILVLDQGELVDIKTDPEELLQAATAKAQAASAMTM